MEAEASYGGGESDPLPLGAPEAGYYVGLEPSCPPEYADVPIGQLMADLDAQQQAATGTDDEVVAAGFLPRAAGSRGNPGFESGGALDACVPGGPLAGLADAATRDGRLSELDDDELIGVLRAWRRLESWCSSGTLAATAELARRRPADRTPPASATGFPAQLSEFIGDEVAAALTLTGRAADAHLELALDLALRLPATDRAHREGIIDYPKTRLIADLTRVLSDEHARQVEDKVLAAAGQQTTGQLRAAVGRAVLAVDPEAAIRRREEAQRDPRVRRWQEDAGTAALAGYGLPPADVLQADQRITDGALRLRDTGLPGSLEELRARAYLDILLGQDSAPPAGQRRPEGAPLSPAPRRLAARVNLTVPLLTHFGLAAEPGTVAGFGPVDPVLVRELTTLAAAHPVSRFCVTVTGTDGRAIGHGCIPGRPPDTGCMPGRPPDHGHEPGRPPDHGDKPGDAPVHGDKRGHPPDLNPAGTSGFTVTVSPLAGEDCDHRHQEAAYKPSRKLRHLIWARTPTCCAPGCRRPAARCDLDHTVPYDQGGRTCECDLAPLCRHHHRCKQAEGWRLEQPSPGVMRWTTPAGRRYHLRP
jgi:hypothetical protein